MPGSPFHILFTQSPGTDIRLLEQTKYYKDENFFVRTDYGGSRLVHLSSRSQETHAAEVGYRTAANEDTVAFSTLIISVTEWKNIQLFTFGYFFKSDHRDLVAILWKGRYFDFEFNQRGFGFPERRYSKLLCNPDWKTLETEQSVLLYCQFTGMYTVNKYTPYFLYRGLDMEKIFCVATNIMWLMENNMVLFKDQ